MKLKKSVRHRLEFALLVLCTCVFRLIPFRVNLTIAGVLGGLLFHLNRKHRERALYNLTQAFPKKKKMELLYILREVYINLCKVYIEFLYLPLLRKSYFKKNVSVKGVENLDKALKKKKGIIAVTGHIDNWELLGAIMIQTGYPLDALYHPMRNPYSDRFINRIREKAGIGLIDMNRALRPCLKALKKNHLLGLIADQDAGRDGVFVDFFKRPASTAIGPAFFSIKTRAPMLLFTLIREKDDTHTLHISKELKVRVTGNTEKDIYYNTKLWSDEFEKWVRKYPAQWFWVHRKWHTKKNL